jgi:hypothetical protein
MEYSFATSSIGGPLDPDVVLDGRTYGIVLNEVVAVSPVGIASLLATIPSNLSSLWQFHSVGAGSELAVDTGLAVLQGEGVVQDACTPTHGLLSAADGLTLDDAYFSNAPDLLTFWLSDRRLEFEEAIVDGDFSPDGSSIEEVSVRGWLASESLAQLVPADSSGTNSIESGCLWVEEHLAASCVTCPSGGEGCLWVHVRLLSGELQATPLTPVPVAATAACDEDDSLHSELSCSMGGDRGLPAAWLLLLPAALLLRRRS